MLKLYDEALRLVNQLSYHELVELRQYIDILIRYDTDNSETESSNHSQPPQLSHMEQSKQKHPRAYQPWTDAEEAKMLDLIKMGKSVNEVATILERQPSAIHSRLRKIEERNQ
jgi:DNA-binding NarL/FixJ family response regulator